MKSPCDTWGFRTGVSKTKWAIDSMLKAINFLFDESPAIREDYIKITGADVFPLPFCSHRLLEDKKVAEESNKSDHTSLPTIKKTRNKIPASGSFTRLRSAVKDGLIPKKLECFL